MAENEIPDENLNDEFRALGLNLVNALRTAWESPERKKLQAELEEGLSGLAATLSSEIENFQVSETGQRLRSDAAELRDKVRDSKTEKKIRDELIKTLHIVNTELENTAQRWSPTEENAPIDEDNESNG
jgi:hypothetical protein